MTLVDIFLVSVAVSAVIDTWFTGSIFEKQRQQLDARTGFWADMLSCKFCLTHWVAAVLCLLVVVPPLLLGPWVAELCRIPAYVMVVVWLAYRINLVTGRGEENADGEDSSG